MTPAFTMYLIFNGWNELFGNSDIHDFITREFETQDFLQIHIIAASFDGKNLSKEGS